MDGLMGAGAGTVAWVLGESHHTGTGGRLNDGRS
jgi:hypothetical protein